ncbi:MAG: hypothetical protein ABL897_04030 [Hyphomicrobium sp.]
MKSAKSTSKALLRAAAAMTLVLVYSYQAFPSPADPPVPPGRNPGGQPVAFINGGIDYTRPPFSTMLARDGEGEIIGYDFADDDRRPYDANGDTAAAGILLGEGQAATLVLLRASAGNTISIGKAIGYAAKSPARIVAITLPMQTTNMKTLLSAATARFPSQLFIVAAGDDGLDLDANRAPEAAALPNVIVVTSAQERGTLTTNANSGASSVDLAINSTARLDHTAWSPNTGNGQAPSNGTIALARLTALAARLRAVEPELPAAGLKEKIMTLAAPLPGADSHKTRGGWIAEPWRHFWLE